MLLNEITRVLVEGGEGVVGGVEGGVDAEDFLEEEMGEGAVGGFEEEVGGCDGERGLSGERGVGGGWVGRRRRLGWWVGIEPVGVVVAVVRRLRSGVGWHGGWVCGERSC